MSRLERQARSSFWPWLCVSTALILVNSSFVSGSQLEASSRGLRTRARTFQGATQNVPLYSGYHALVVGCGDYRKGWPQLPNPVQDAQDVADDLQSMGWQVDLLQNPTAAELRRALTKLVTGPGKIEDRGILFWFSGHGYTLNEVDGSKLGYVVPVDAPDPDRDLMGFMEQAINMRQIETIAKGILAKHVLMVFDSCFSGAIFQMVRAKPSPYLEEKAALPVRQFITSGREDEQVPDKSTFKICFLQGVKDGFADRNNDGFVTGEELGAYLQEQVVNYTNRAQHPQFGKINNPMLDKGDFVFVNANLSTQNDKSQETARLPENGATVAAKKVKEDSVRVVSDSTKPAVIEEPIAGVEEVQESKTQLAKVKELDKSLSSPAAPQPIPADGRLMMTVLSPLVKGGGGSSDYSQRLGSLLIQTVAAKKWIKIVPASPSLDNDKAWSGGRLSGASPDMDFLCKQGELAGLDIVLLVRSYVHEGPVTTMVENADVFLVDIHKQILYKNWHSFGSHPAGVTLPDTFSAIEKTVKELLESYEKENPLKNAAKSGFAGKPGGPAPASQTADPTTGQKAAVDSEESLAPSVDNKNLKVVISTPLVRGGGGSNYSERLVTSLSQETSKNKLFEVVQVNSLADDSRIWMKSGFSQSLPNVEYICKLGRPLGLNAVILSSSLVREGLHAYLDDMEIFIVDINEGKLYRSKCNFGADRGYVTYPQTFSTIENTINKLLFNVISARYN